jgi:hypothetical protein
MRMSCVSNSYEYLLTFLLTVSRVDNFVPGKMEELGMGYEKLRSINPSIIHASVSGLLA